MYFEPNDLIFWLCFLSVTCFAVGVLFGSAGGRRR